MKLRRHIFASVCSALLAASVAAAGSASASATTDQANQKAEQAYRLLISGDQKKAISYYTEAIESRQLPAESLANALLNRAYAQQSQNQFTAAIDDYTAALKLDALTAEMRASALYNRGLSYQRMKNNSSAVEDYTSALFLKPDFSLAYYARGNALRSSGQYLFALADYRSAISYKYPNLALVHFAEAQVYEKLKRPVDEKTALEAALVANPKFAAAAQRLALLNGQPQKAMAVQSAPPVELPSTDNSAPQNTVAQATAALPKAVEPPAALMLPHAGDPIETAAVDVSKPGEQLTDNQSAATPTREDVAAAPKSTVKKVHTERVLAVEPVEEITTSTEQNTQPASTSGWAVQVASASSEAAAWSTWKKMQASHKVLAEQKAVVVKADLGNKGIVYRVRVTGFDDQNAAKSSCNKLRAGGVSCFISKTDS